MKIIKQYYENNSELLIDKYLNANVLELNEIFIKYLKSKVIDLGCGSGRDMVFLNKYLDVYGLDLCDNFITHCKKSFGNKVSYTKLPNIDLSSFDINKFDSVISISTFMHLTKNEIIKTIINLKSILKSNGQVIVSYTTDVRINDERFFEDFDDDFIKDEFEKLGFIEKEFLRIKDSLNRNLLWSVKIYEL